MPHRSRIRPPTLPLLGHPPHGCPIGSWLVLLGALWLAACDGGQNATKAAGPGGGMRERQAKSVLTAPVASRSMEKVLETTAVLESDREISVLPRSPGVVVELLAEEGDRVEAGQVLARLDDREASLNLRDLENALEETRQREATLLVAIDEARSRVQTAETNLAQAQRDLDRDEQLFSGGDSRVASVSEKALEASRLARDRATLELDQARFSQQRAELDHQSAGIAKSRAETARDRASLTLEFTRILAPIDGLVSSRSMRVGENVTGAAPAFVVTDPELLRVIFYRPQSERSLFRSGGPLDLTSTTESLPGQVFAGQVERVGATIDPTSGSFRVTARLDPRPLGADGSPDELGPRLAPGMLLRIKLVTERRPDCLVVPKRAIEREGERAHVVLLVNGRAERVLVEEGLSDLDSVEIQPTDRTAESAKLLVPGARVVIVGARDLQPGEELKDDSLDAAAEPSEKQPEARAGDSVEAGPANAAGVSGLDETKPETAPQAASADQTGVGDPQEEPSAVPAAATEEPR